MTQKNLGQKLVDQGVLTPPSQDKIVFTKEEQEELNKVRQKLEQDRAKEIEQEKFDSKTIKKVGLFAQVPGGLILGVTLLANLLGENVNPQETMINSIFGGLMVVAPIAINGINRVSNRFRFQRNLKKALRSKEKDILKSKEQAMKKSLSDTIAKKLKEVDKSHTALMERVSHNIDKKLAAKKLKPKRKVAGEMDMLAEKAKAIALGSQKARTLRETLTKNGNLTTDQIMTLRKNEEKARFAARKKFLKEYQK